jgi:cytochrome P450
MSPNKPVVDWTTDFDYLDPQWIEDPYPVWDELRAKCPIAHTERYVGAYLPTRYEDIREVASDTEHFSSRRVILREGRPPIVPAPPLTSDPPEHKAHRKILVPAFTVDAVKRLEPRTRSICRDLIDRIAGKQRCDGAADYAQEVPTRVTAYMLGVDETNGELFRNWVQDFFERGIADLGLVAKVIGEIREFFGKEIAKRRAAKLEGEDLVTVLVKARIDGQPLDDEQICNTIRLLLMAGIDTTWSSIGASLWHLANHPEHRARLVAEPELIPTAVDEFLRAYAPATMAREVVKERRIGDCVFKEGEMVLVPYPAANRDPEKFADANRVVLDRKPNPHVAFGVGIHRCIGENLARMEMKVAVEEWLARFPQFRMAPGAEVHWSRGPVRGPRRLEFVLGASARSRGPALS